MDQSKVLETSKKVGPNQDPLGEKEIIPDPLNSTHTLLVLWGHLLIAAQQTSDSQNLVVTHSSLREEINSNEY